ncbi:MAG: IclR family transcriptional regulator [Gammaproteobacteria bacterium]|nr:IclR family transcriptional regulator [Gammaproteobacteria bacterium]MCW8987297.1 IclR family transcriptional regulator [Gammaproteobacteria bacterium]MCW9030568.1 IclR family transcriptional regulator [Gammaproteobacteria bacterium]
MSSIQVIDRSVSLLDAISQYEDPVSLKILSAESRLHPSTAFRILAALTEAGLVEKDTAGHYMLGNKLVRLASKVRRGIDLRERALDIMEALCDQIGETVNLTVREGDEVIYIERVTAKRMMRVEQVIGSRAPLHVTAVGKLMLAELGEHFIRAYASRTGLKSYTRHTISTEADLLNVTQQANTQGFAYDNEEAEEGVGCIGVLIYDGNHNVVAGLSISAPIERRKEEWVKLVKAAGKKISERLGA